jgi:hypothetical protein
VQCKSQLRHFVWLPTTKILRPGRETSAVDWLAALAHLEMSWGCLVVKHWYAMVTSSYQWWGYHSNISKNTKNSSKNTKNITRTQRLAQEHKEQRN